MPLLPLLFVLAALPPLSDPPPPDPAPSFIAAPVVVDLAHLFAAAERATPRVPPGVETWTNLPGPALGGATYRFNLYRDPLDIQLAGNRLTVHTTLNYWLQVGLRMKGWVKGVATCGVAPESYRRARLGLQAEVRLTPGWGLDLHITPEEPQQLDPCQVTLLGYDITGKVLAGMKDALVKAAQGMEQQLRDDTTLRHKVENAWIQAQQPVELSPGVHLLLNPERVRMSPWHSEGNLLTITPEIQVRPAITLGVAPLVPFRPLPPLDQTPAPIQPGFRLRVEADLGFDQATAQLSRQMVGRRFETDKGAFEVRSIAVRGSAGNVLLELGLKGRVDGKLTLTGHPRFDEQTGTIRLDGLDYTLESSSWLTRLGVWLFSGTLRQTLSEKCNFFMDKSFQDLKAQAQQGLNRDLGPGMAMSGTIAGFTLDRIQVQDDRLQLVALLDGQIQIALKPGL
jgi:hypothetical protein